MKGTRRILRYVGNRPKPDERLWETIDDYVPVPQKKQVPATTTVPSSEPVPVRKG